MRTMSAAVLLIGLLAGGCSAKKKPATPITQPAITVLDKAQERLSPSPLQARFQIKLRSKPLGIGGTTGGGLQIVRPGQARMEIFGPFGGSLASLISDGSRFSLYMPRDQRHMLAPDAEALVRKATRGAFGLDGVVGLLVGDLPFQAGELTETSVNQAEGLVQAQYEGPDQVKVDLDLDPEQFTPTGLRAYDQQGDLLLGVVYENWQPHAQTLLPQRVELTIPSVELFISLKYQGWQEPEELMDYDTSAPAGLVSEPLMEILRLSLAALREDNGAASP